MTNVNFRATCILSYRPTVKMTEHDMWRYDIQLMQLLSCIQL